MKLPFLPRFPHVTARYCLFRWMTVLLIVAIYPSSSIAECLDEIKSLNEIHYEFRDLGPRTPVIVMVPGFTQHNCSPEFTLLQKHFLDLGMSVLTMNPPQHGGHSDYHGRAFAWGEQESQDLLDLVHALNLKSHGRIFALGFSIGAKTVLRFAALNGAQDSLVTVMAVAPPTRVGDINALMSGDVLHPLAGDISARLAVGRSSLARIFYMIFVGLPKALFVNKRSPYDQIPAIKVPILLVHGSADWLIKSNHSVRLFESADSNQPITLVILNTHTHAEDMLTQATPSVAKGLLDVLDTWIRLVDNGQANGPKDSLQARFQGILDTTSWVKDNRVSQRRISHLDYPTLLMPGTNLWYSTPNEHPAKVSAHFAQSLNHSQANRFFLDAAPWSGKTDSWHRFAMGLSGEDSSFTAISKLEASLSWYYPWGSFLWMRRIGFLSGVSSGPRRHILSADMVFLLLNFQVGYGEYSPGKQDVEMLLTFPLISHPNSDFFLGGGYQNFFTQSSKEYPQDALHTFLVFGPPYPILGTRLRFNVQYGQNGFYAPGWNPNWSLGVSISLHER